MLKYGSNTSIFKPEKLHSQNIDRQSVSFIESNARVLEIGCATGFMGEYLIRHKGCEVIGVELGRDEARVAVKKLSKVIVGDIEDKSTIGEIVKFGTFDVVFASALIEHLKDPWIALHQWRKFLKPKGYIVVSTSNIAHWSMRVSLLKGKFQYSDYGILDNTHLRFFTLYSFQKLIQDAGYITEQIGIDAVGGGFPKVSLLGSKFFPNLFTYQMVIKARK